MIHVKVGMHPTQPVEPEKVGQPKPEAKKPVEQPKQAPKK